MNSLNPEGIAYYNRLIDELVANKITPVVSVCFYQGLKPKYIFSVNGVCYFTIFQFTKLVQTIPTYSDY